MNKKIALLLILFMVGSWCVFADDGDDDFMTGIWITIGVIAGVGFIVAMVLILTGHPDEGQAVWGSVVGEAKPSEDPEPIETVMQNPLIKHTAFGINDDKIFVGAKFSW